MAHHNPGLVSWVLERQARLGDLSSLTTIAPSQLNMCSPAVAGGSADSRLSHYSVTVLHCHWDSLITVQIFQQEILILSSDHRSDTLCAQYM